jgi:UDP-N-acetylglucosamine--N-acetylmuramyl-(pentapeptide) pyrophosphoryl-undecaprenol N-acetylglucosamine transferase
VEPALAVGRWLTKADSDIELEFIGTKSGVEVELLIDTGIKFHPILKVPFPRKVELKTIAWPIKFKISFLQSLSAIKGADLVIGFGGYVSAPAYIAAKVLRVPLMIHEANAKPGLANKLGAKLTENLFIAFESAKKLGGNWGKAKLVGMPIKEELDNFNTLNRDQLKREFLSNLSLDGSKKTLLVFGGSIGAKQINSAMSGAQISLSSTGWNVIHAVGGANSLPESRGSYRALSYIQDMVSAYAAADFVISRSGAVTCAELQATGIPALLVPLQIGNGEQDANAQELLESGQARKISNLEFNAEWLSANIQGILAGAPERISGVTRHAAAQIGEIALTLI